MKLLSHGTLRHSESEAYPKILFLSYSIAVSLQIISVTLTGKQMSHLLAPLAGSLGS